MKKEKYKIVRVFECSGKKMLVTGMKGAACVMPEEEYNRIIIAERRYNQLIQQEVA